MAPVRVPLTAHAALRDPNWLAMMQEEFDAQQRNRTWQLIPCPPHANIISGKWVFRHKTRPDDTLERYMARREVHSFRQRTDVYFTDTFGPVVKSGTIHTILQLASVPCLARTSDGRLQRLPPWAPHRAGLLLAAHWLPRRRSSRARVLALALTLWAQASSTCMVPEHRRVSSPARVSSYSPRRVVVRSSSR